MTVDDRPAREREVLNIGARYHSSHSSHRSLAVALAVLCILGSLSSDGLRLPRPALLARVSACGTHLCAAGHVWTLRMGSIYGGLDTPQKTVAEAVALRLNTIRVTDFLDVGGSPQTAPYDGSSWRAVDQLIAAAARSGLHVELDLSTYRNLLGTAGLDPYTYSWSSFLHFVVNRTNTVTGVRYGSDATIALVSFAGEADAPRGGSNTWGLTTSGLTAFYGRVEQTWHDAAPRQLLTAGGLDQLSWNSGIDWRSIFGLPYNAVDAIHVYSGPDRLDTLPAVASYSHRIGRPWITEEFGFPAALGDRTRAAGFQDLFALNRRYGSAGTGFWNVGRQTEDTYDVGPQSPRTAAVVTRWDR